MPGSGRGVSTGRFTTQDDTFGFSRLTTSLWSPQPGLEPSPELRSDLARTIETEIIPRLMLAHRLSETARPEAKPAGRAAGKAIFFSGSDVEQFCDVIVRQPLSAARLYIDTLRARGMSIETVITTVLSDTARHLGLLWETDRCTFVDVTVGLSRLQQLLRIYGPDFEAQAEMRAVDQRILLTAVPGEQHTFGLAVVEEFFRRAGWDVQSDVMASKQALLARVGEDWFDVVGLSASGESIAADLAGLIRAIRATALNRDVRVVLGGVLFTADPDLALTLGADSGARDASDALTRVEALLEAKKISC